MVTNFFALPGYQDDNGGIKVIQRIKKANLYSLDKLSTQLLQVIAKFIKRNSKIFAPTNIKVACCVVDQVVRWNLL